MGHTRPFLQGLGEPISILGFLLLRQQFSPRVDVLSKPFIRELEKLQDRVPPFPTPMAKQIIEEEQSKPLQVSKDFIVEYEQREAKQSERLDSEVQRHIECLRRLRTKSLPIQFAYACQSEPLTARYGMVRHGTVRHVWLLTFWCGTVRHGEARYGRAVAARYGRARHGARYGRRLPPPAGK